jgi:DNA-binding NarL/FixJ family response regulator
MEATDKVTVLLADEDALRRDGLAAVLEATARFEVVAQCPDGEAALQRLRELRPEVAVVDLNLPLVHGIELVRRVRSETLGTKVVIMAGTSDDEIIREVVRAGGDGYLLKNGPSRHLIDAISYVRDGGQYFSPQLHRDGRDRHLLEEPVRAPLAESTARDAAEPIGDEAEPASENRSARESRAGRARRTARRPGSGRLRERLREEADGGDLGEKDYEILDMMAEGIRPILDRLDEIDARVNQMETGDAPVPSDVRNWLDSQMVDTFRDPRAGTRELTLGRDVKELEARLPEMIEQAVTSRFHHMANKLQKDIEDTHVRTMETFVKNIQVKLVQRVTALETGMSHQAEAMQQLREYSQRTEDNLTRLLTGVDKLAQELPRRLQAPAAPAPPTTTVEAHIETDPPMSSSSAPAAPRRLRKRKFRMSLPIAVWSVVLLAAVGAAGYHFLGNSFGGDTTTINPDGTLATPTSKSGGTSASKPAAIPVGGDTKTKLEAAELYVERKDYSMAENIYKEILQTEPNNVDAMKALASVLYREDKIEESAAILDKLPKN